MNTSLLLLVVLLYFLVLLGIAFYTSKNANNDSFFIGNRNSNWLLVAFGMIGTSLSGVTFVSVPGTVGNPLGASHTGFSYMQVVIGYFIGYFVVAQILLPLYYRLGLTSIYTYLQQRFGNYTYKTGAIFFIISRTLGATARLYLVINVLQIFLLNDLHIPFLATTLFILIMILLYTYKGGVKTIVYTDTLQTACMLIGLIACIGFLYPQIAAHGFAWKSLTEKHYTDFLNTDFKSKGFFLKQLLGGAFITISMTGLDQEMMQKNISVKNLGDAKKNMFTFSTVMLIVNFLFLLLGGFLYLYALKNGANYHSFLDKNGKETMGVFLNGKNIIGDNIFPTLALFYLPIGISILFLIGLVSALFPSADGALTALTSSFCIDILDFNGKKNLTEKKKKEGRHTVHLIFAALFVVCIMYFKWINDRSIINLILDIAGYTYGPLLGLFAFGILTKRKLNDGPWIILLCLEAPAFCFLLSKYSKQLFNGYEIGVELLLINAIMVFLMLFLTSKKEEAKGI